MKIVVTGAAGFIGSNLVKGLNARGIDDIIAVDDLTDGDKFRNLADLQIADYIDADDFYDLFAEGAFGSVEAVFHEGACSDTMETDGKYMMDNNYALSCELFESCQEQGTRLLYASSAATYGGSDTFSESPEFEKPLNVYGYSKLLFDSACGASLAAALKTPRRRWPAFGISTFTAPASSTKAGWRASPFTSSTSFKWTAKSSSLASTAATARAARCVTSFSSTMWWRLTCGFLISRQVRHLQSRYRPGPAFQRRGHGCGQHLARRRKGRTPQPGRGGAWRTDRLHRFS